MGNRALSYYFPKEAAGFYAPGSRIESWRLAILGHIPMLSERSSFWGKVELLRRFLAEIGMPKHKTNRFGRAQDFAALEPKDVVSFTERCNDVLRQQKEFSAPIKEIFRLAREHGAKLILLEMPLPSRHRELFYSSPVWAQMRAHLRSVADREGAIYISASDWIQNDSNFEDATHLTEQGARLFSQKLALTLSR